MNDRIYYVEVVPGTTVQARPRSCLDFQIHKSRDYPVSNHFRDLTAINYRSGLAKIRSGVSGYLR